MAAEPTVAEPSTGPAGEAPAATPVARRSGGHLHQVDIVRLLTFVCVIGVHTTSYTNPTGSWGAGALEVLLHFTRDAFFLLSAFVLMYVYQRRGVQLRTFWGRRFFYIGVPYVVWTVVYWAFLDGHRAWTLRGLARLGTEIANGTAQYHLYFLLVSMQLYLLFPALLWLVRRTAGHHGKLFVWSLLLQASLQTLLHYWSWPGSALGTAHYWAYELFPTYWFYFVAGALAAAHHDRFHAWVTTHPRQLLQALVGLALLVEGVYFLQIWLTGHPLTAADPVQPVMIPWSLAVAAGFYAVGDAWARRREKGRLGGVVDQASQASFGVYLLHPLVLSLFLRSVIRPHHVPAPGSTVLAWAVVLIASFLVVGVVIRTPLALPFTGRKRYRPGGGEGG